jgi:hypothetical protein
MRTGLPTTTYIRPSEELTSVGVAGFLRWSTLSKNVLPGIIIQEHFV